MKIKILSTTPFHKAGETLSISEFRDIYGNGICLKSTTDEELIEFLEVDDTFKNYFSVHKTQFDDDLPLCMMIEGLIYSKQLDGFYHKFLAGSPITPEHSLGAIQRSDLSRIIQNMRYKKSIWTFTNHANHQLK